MSVSARWHSDHHPVLHLIFDGEWAWADVYQQFDQARAALEQMPHEFALILEVRGDLFIPGGSLFCPDNLDQVAALMARRDWNQGPVFVVSSAPGIRTTYDILRMMHPRAANRVYFTDTFAEAIDYLCDADFFRPVRKAS